MDDQPPRILDDAAPDLHIEVTPLSPSPAMPGGRPVPPRGKPVWRAFVIAGAIMIALAVIFSGYFPTRTPLTGWALPQPTATNTPEPTPVLFGNVPTYCPPGNPVETFSPSFGPGVGVYGLPLWFVGFDGPQATARLTGGGPPTARGWPYRLGIVARSDITQPIILSVKGMFGVAGQVWFSTSGVDNPISPLVLDPTATPLQSDDWHGWLFYMLLPSSGCFFLDVQSGDTQSGMFFAAGV